MQTYRLAEALSQQLACIPGAITKTMTRSKTPPVRSQNFISHLNQWLAIQVCVPFRAALRRATNE